MNCLVATPDGELVAGVGTNGTAVFDGQSFKALYQSDTVADRVRDQDGRIWSAFSSASTPRGIVVTRRGTQVSLMTRIFSVCRAAASTVWPLAPTVPCGRAARAAA